MATNALLANVLPEDCIVAVDSGGGNLAFEMLQTSVPHTWLSLTGGSIGQGGPVATGAAVACPNRRVVALLGDGGAMYTIQSLWTQAREGLDVTTVIYCNRKYWILAYEYNRLGLSAGDEKGAGMFDIGNPDVGWVELAGAMGVPGSVAHTAEEFAEALQKSFSQPGPYLIEAKTSSRF